MGNQTQYAYNSAGDLTTVTQLDTHGHSETASYTYDVLHRLTSETNAAGAVTDYTYDADNNLLAVAGYNDGQGSFTYTFDVLGRMISQKNALGDTTLDAYDGVGNLIQETNPLGYVTTNRYDAQGNLVATTDPLGGVTHYTFNLAGWQTSETDPVRQPDQLFLRCRWPGNIGNKPPGIHGRIRLQRRRRADQRHRL